MVKRHPHNREFRFGSERLDEVAAVLEVSPEATDTEICDSVNHWWKRIGQDDEPLQPYDVTVIRSELGIPQTPRKPFQKRLFYVKIVE
jgi:hypothetical protein